MILHDSVMIFRFISKEPHIAASTRQKELAVELAKRWKEYGFDHVEQPEYEALLSFPNTTHPTRITIKYENDTIIHQIKGEEQVSMGRFFLSKFSLSHSIYLSTRTSRLNKTNFELK